MSSPSLQSSTRLESKMTKKEFNTCFGCRAECLVIIFATLQIVCSGSGLIVFGLILVVALNSDEVDEYDEEIAIRLRYRMEYFNLLAHYCRLIVYNCVWSFIFGLVLLYGTIKKRVPGDTESHLTMWIFYVAACWFVNFLLIREYESRNATVVFSVLYFILVCFPLRAVCILIQERHENFDNVYELKGQVKEGSGD